MAQNNFAAALIRRPDPDLPGAYEYLVINYFPVVIDENGNRKRRGRFHLKFMGGGGRHKESPWEACRREVLEEAFIAIRGGRRLCQYTDDEGHTQHFFVVEWDRCKYQKCLRKSWKEDGEADLSPPHWVKQEMVNRMLFPTHLRAFRKIQMFR